MNKKWENDLWSEHSIKNKLTLKKPRELFFGGASNEKNTTYFACMRCGKILKSCKCPTLMEIILGLDKNEWWDYSKSPTNVS